MKLKSSGARRYGEIFGLPRSRFNLKENTEDLGYNGYGYIGFPIYRTHFLAERSKFITKHIDVYFGFVTTLVNYIN